MGRYPSGFTDPVSAGGVHVGGISIGNVRFDLRIGGRKRDAISCIAGLKIVSASKSVALLIIAASNTLTFHFHEIYGKARCILGLTAYHTSLFYGPQEGNNSSRASVPSEHVHLFLAIHDSSPIAGASGVITCPCKQISISNP